MPKKQKLTMPTPLTSDTIFETVPEKPKAKKRPRAVAVKKTPAIYRLHKIKIHQNRWLIWAIAYTVIVATALVAYIRISDINFESEQTQAVNHVVHTPQVRTYLDANLGFEVNYPSDWSVESTDSSTVSITPNDSADEGVSIAVLKPTAETSIRKNIKKVSETRITLDNNRAVKIINQLDTGSQETVIMALRNNQLYVIRGSDDLVEQLIPTFYFTN